MDGRSTYFHEKYEIITTNIIKIKPIIGIGTYGYNTKKVRYNTVIWFKYML
jgi:hypothetical protein